MIQSICFDKEELVGDITKWEEGQMDDKWGHEGAWSYERVWSLTVRVEVKSESGNCGTGKIN